MGKKAKVITISNSKGGSAKSFTGVQLASMLAKEGKKILLVDMDPKNDLTTSFLPRDEITPNMADVLLKDVDISEAMINVMNYWDQTKEDVHAYAEALESEEEKKNQIASFQGTYDHLDRKMRQNIYILPGHDDLKDCQEIIKNNPLYYTILKEKITPFLNQFDYVIIDPPGYSGQVIDMAMYCADIWICPLMSGDMNHLKGAHQVYAKFHNMPQRDEMQVITYITNYDSRNNIEKEAVEEVSQDSIVGFEQFFIKEPVPRNTNVQKAAAKKLTMLEYHDSMKAKIFKRDKARLYKTIQRFDEIKKKVITYGN